MTATARTIKIAGRRIEIVTVSCPMKKRKSIWDEPAYQAWLRKSYEDARRTVERLAGG